MRSRSQEEPDDWPADYDGSAKVALPSIDRSRVARITAERGLAPVTEVEPFVAELGILAMNSSANFQVRAFIRPGFDELGAVVDE